MAGPYPGPAESEGRFTRPTNLCPHPERWTSTDDHSTEIEVSEFIGGLVRCLQPDLCFETGAAWGQTALEIGIALDANGRGRLVTCEPDPERAEHTRRRCQGYPVDVYEGSSLDWQSDAPIEFAFFDSLFDLRVPEFWHVRPLLRTGAIVAFHDTAPMHGQGAFPSGRDLRDEVATELASQLRVIHFPTPRGITIGEVL